MHLDPAWMLGASHDRLPIAQSCSRKSGAVIGMVRLSVQDDDQALERARSMVDGHAVELWDGMRFIELFPPVD